MKNPRILESSNPRILESSNPRILESSNPRILESSNPRNFKLLLGLKYGLIFMVLALLLPLSSCEKEDYNSNENKEYNLERSSSRSLSTDSIDYYLDLVAKTVAKAQGSVKFRTFLLNHMNEEGNDLETGLMAQLIHKEVDGVNFASVLSQFSQQAGVYRDSLFFAKELIYLIPNLSISFYTDDVEIEDWEWPGTANFLPVMPVVESFYDTVPGNYVAYYLNLDTTYFSNAVDPTTPVIIVQAESGIIPIDMVSLDQIGGNELYSILLDICEDLEMSIEDALLALGNLDLIILVDGQIRINPEFNIALVNLAALLEEYNEECGEGPGPGPGQPDECDRDDRECREVITQWRMPNGKPDVKQFCPWIKKFCQIRVYTRFFFRDSQGAVTAEEKPDKFLDGRRKYMREKEIITSNLPMYKYRYLEGFHADFYYYTFAGVHPSGGSSRTFGFSLGGKYKFSDDVEINATISLSFTKTRRDYELGGDEIYYCDPANGLGTKYTSGRIEFWVKEDESCLD